MPKLIVSFVTLAVLVSCAPQIKEQPPTLNGVWQSLGSGWQLEVKDSMAYVMYDVTQISCLPNGNGDLEEIAPYLQLHNDTLSLTKGVITYNFIRMDALPRPCQEPLSDTLRYDPLHNFEVFAATVGEHYAFFGLNGIDWETLYRTQKVKLNRNSTDLELYQVLQETLQQLDDNHGFLEATPELYAEMEDQMPSAPIGQETDLPEYGDFEVAQKVAEHHLLEEMTEDSWLIQWGKLAENFGYLQVKAMWLFADLQVPKALVEELGYVDAYIKMAGKRFEAKYIEEEVLGVSKIMDRAMHDLSDFDSMVIDLRFNGGGQDAVGFEILSRFLPEQRWPVAKQQLRMGNGHTAAHPIYIEGSKNAFGKPVYVLTSPQTGSAAEAFAIATMAFEHIKRIGAPTMGATSTALEKTLPNGWSFAISNEIYMDTQGLNYENKGVPVDYELPYPKDRQTFFRKVVNDLDGDKNAILRAIDDLSKW